jgi:hypothetical protein
MPGLFASAALDAALASDTPTLVARPSWNPHWQADLPDVVSVVLVTRRRCGSNRGELKRSVSDVLAFGNSHALPGRWAWVI